MEIEPWPAFSRLIAYQGRIWGVNSVKGRNHNSADVYSYDPVTGEMAYERHLFSQDGGRPTIHDGWLFWPYEDARVSLGWGAFQVTDGTQWALGLIDTSRAFHTHAMAASPTIGEGDRLYAATSAWRAKVQISDDGGRSWRQIYDHPTPEGRVSRIVELQPHGDELLVRLSSRQERGLFLLSPTGALRPLPGWPENPVTAAWAVDGEKIFAVLGSGEGQALWVSDGVTGKGAGGLPKGAGRVRDLAAADGRLWLLTAGVEDGRVWSQPLKYAQDGADWRQELALTGGRPSEMLFACGGLYLAGSGVGGEGALWGQDFDFVEPCPDEAPRGPWRANLVTSDQDWRAELEAFEALLMDPASYRGHGGLLRDQALRLVRAGPAPEVWAALAALPLPEDPLPLIGGAVEVPSAHLGRWVIFWAQAQAGEGRVDPYWLQEPWQAPENPSEKYFETLLAAIAGAAASGQEDGETVAALIDQLADSDAPLWLKGDVIGALSAITGERFAYDPAAWKKWWKARTP
ncbi:MAG: hypothetical protein AAF530_14295 [Pseudomonadota bacterium]